MNKRKDVIVACDFPSEAELDNFVGLFKRYEKKPFLKVGMELFYSAGPDVVRRLKGEGFDVFLDLMVNLHAAGGSEMMKRAAEGLVRHDGARPLLIAVTQLTSTSENMLKNELLINCDMETTVASYAQNAARCGLDGVVCSPLEARLVKEACGKDFLTVTPGIRFADGEKGDQVRVTTPQRAKEIGSDFIVVGRPITAAENPAEAYFRCVKEFLG